MSGYTPLFSSITTGTLCGKWPDIGLWPLVLSMADRHGRVDVTHQYIATVTGLSVEDVVACMARFCKPDPHSRSAEEGGARLCLLEPHRDWGWQVVNHAKYAEKARKKAYDDRRTATGADADRKRESRDVPTGPDESRAVPLSTQLNSTASKKGEGRLRGTRLPADFSLTEDRKQYALDKGLLNVKEEFERFQDHHRAKGTVFLDWDAGWRTWVRNGVKFQAERAGSGKRRPVDRRPD